MKVLLLMPRALYVLVRFAEACQRQSLDLTVMMSPTPPIRRYLASFASDTFENVVEVPAGADDPDLVAPFLSGIDAVVPAGEFSVIFAERLAQRLGLFHNPLDRVEAYRNKLLMRSAFAESGVDQPKVLARFESMAAVREFDWRSVRFPVIVKPIDLSSSLYVRLCHDAATAEKVFQRIFRHTQSFSGLAFAAQGLVEEAVFGPEYSAECVVQDGRLVRLFSTTKFVSPYPACDEVAHLAGEPLSDGVAAKVRAAAEGVIAAWRLDSGVLHVEYKLCGGDVKVIEGACRVGGDLISEVTELAHGVSLEECLVLIRAGRDVGAALDRGAHARSDHVYGVQYLFSENLASPVPRDVEVLREYRYAAAEGGHRPGGGFGVERRLGYRLMRSRSLAALKSCLAAELSQTAA